MREKSPRLSVVLPTYNHAYFLPETLEAIVHQQFTDWELVIVNDASTDNTDEVVKSFLGDKRIRYIKRHKNGGAAGMALNTGFRLCKGRYETWWAADNVLYSNAWRLLVKFLDEHPEIDHVYANEEIDMYNTPIQGGGIPDRINLWERTDMNWRDGEIINGYFMGVIWMWRRPLRLAVGKFQKEPCEDFDFALKAEEKGFKFAFLPECLGLQRFHPDNLTNRRARPEHHDWNTRNKALLRRGSG